MALGGILVSVTHARSVLYRLRGMNVGAWTAMITGHVEHKAMYHDALDVPCVKKRRLLPITDMCVFCKHMQI